MSFRNSLLITGLILMLGSGLTSQAGDGPPDQGLLPPVAQTWNETPFSIGPAYTGCGGVYDVPSSNEVYEQEILDRVNDVRGDHGLPPLKRSDDLDDASRYHATDMAQDGYFDHDSYDCSGGETVKVCDWSERIQTYYSNWRSLAENVAAGYATPESVMNGWLNSSGHRNNILSTGNWEIGIGYYRGGSWRHYWVQDFGRRNGVYPLVIDREARETDSRRVSLYIYGDWEEMRLRNNATDWTDWQPFQNEASWELPRSSGEHTVWAELRSGDSTVITSDTIVLTQSFIPVLSDIPDTISFTYSIAEGRLLSGATRVTPKNVGTDEPLTWAVDKEGAWFTVSPQSGSTPSSFWITPAAFNTGSVASYSGAVTVTVTAPADAGIAPQRIEVSLDVIDAPFSYFYLPLVYHNYTPPTPALYPNDYGRQWALDKMDAPHAWRVSTGQGAVIAVLDTGADLDHPDLLDKLRTDADWDFVSGDGVPDDDHGHGTHVSGIAAATADNEIGVVGLGWDAQILTLKVLDNEGYGEDVTLAEAIRYAVDQGADVINMSLGGEFPCPDVVQSAADYAYGRGVVLVAASGNNSGNTEMFPANCEHILGVSATDVNDVAGSYSNYGAHVSVAAPGTTIYSTLMGGWYGSLSGTSMATPHVSGLVALLAAHFPSYTPDQIASAILDTAEDLGAEGWDEHYGCGRVNAFRALSLGAQGATPACLEGVGDWGTNSEEAVTRASFIPGEVIVTLRPGVNAEGVLPRYAVDAEYLPALTAWRLHVPPGREQDFLARLQADPDVTHAELNYVVSAQ